MLSSKSMLCRYWNVENSSRWKAIALFPIMHNNDSRRIKEAYATFAIENNGKRGKGSITHIRKSFNQLYNIANLLPLWGM